MFVCASGRSDKKVNATVQSSVTNSAGSAWSDRNIKQIRRGSEDSPDMPAANIDAALQISFSSKSVDCTDEMRLDRSLGTDVLLSQIMSG